MLGVLKRRLKPKRATTEKESQNNRKYVHNKSDPVVPVDVARIAPSQRQIHPLFDEKAQLLAYDEKKNPTPAALRRSPEDPSTNPLVSMPKKPPVNSSATLFVQSSVRKSTSSGYHPAPNICVEGGRIEFIKSPSEGSNLASLNPPVTLPPRPGFDKGSARKGISSQYADVSQCKKDVVAATRAQHTQADLADFDFNEEKCDVAKEFLEARIKELQLLLETEQKNVQRERLTISRLQRQLARREATQRDVDKERRLRTDTESRLRETAGESDRYRATLAGLQREFSKMEDTVRTMLQYKSRCELLNQEKVFLTAAYESRINQFQNTVTKLGQENESLKQQVRLLEVTGTEELPDALLERLRSLESENAHLSQDADFQRKQYERCLDDIANQVVRALLSQKGLREEIGHLQRRIKELENQNQALANILMSKLECNGSAFALPSTDGKCHEAISGSPWYPGTFPNDASLPKEVEESSLSNCVDSLATKNGGVKRLRRLYLSDIIDRGDTNVNSVESLVVVPIQRPKSLNLHLRASPRSPTGAVAGVTTKRCQHKKNKLNSVAVASKKPTEDEGNESPESGNRDEGYSTMSSDVQGPGETSELSKRELEDLKEASDETDVILDTNGEMASIVVIEETDPDMFFIPLNLSLTINPRHSYPPHKNFLPFQRAMRSFSDSHLCLKLTGSSPVLPPVFSPSMFFVDIIDKNHPLRRTKATSSLLVKKSDVKEAEETQSCEGSSCSGVADGCWWDAEYVQHWLKLDDNRLKEQQEQREMLQIEYDRTEIEEWSMSLSCEDVAKSASDGDLSLSRRVDETTPGTLPSIRETDFTKGNSDEWTDYNYMNLRIDGKDDEKDTNWSYEENEAETKFAWQETSPRGSWSSESSNKSDDCCRSLNGSCFNECTSEVESRQSSAVSDKESNGEGEVSSTVGTDFTRDFYRLVKFESTKSLASNCSKSNGTCNLTSRNTKQSEIAQEREMALQSVLSFIAEQQRYCHNREEEDGKSEFYDERSSVNLVETADKIVEVSDLLEENELKGVTEHRIIDYRKEASMEQEDITPELSSKESYEELCNKEKDSMANSNNSGSIEFNDSVQTLSSTAAATTAATATRSLKGSRKSFERETKLPVRNSRHSTPKASREECSRTVELKRTRPGRSQKKENYNSIKLEIKESAKRSENTTSKTKITTPPEIVVMQSKSSKSPGKVRETGIPISVTKRTESLSPGKQPPQSRVPRPKVSPRSNGTRIPVVSARKSDSSKQFECGGPPKVVATGSAATETSTSKKSNSGKSLLRKSSPPKSPTSKIVCDDDSFHERATTKDVIDELNRMIRKGDEISPSHGDGELKPLDVACCCPTGWVHVERDIDFTDPKARANLLDVMLASSGSSDETESRSSSSESGADEPVDYSHLHRLHRFRRQRKASATREQLGVLRYSLSSVRPSIIGRENFFIRYGDKEREAVASFDFLEDISTTSVSGCSSCASLGTYHSSCLKSPNDPERDVDVGTPLTPTTPVTPSEDSDERTGGPVSLSDSCADSYTESVGSLEEPFTVKQFAE